MYSIGTRVVYPAHGLSEIRRIDTRNIGGTATDFYVVQVIGNGATLMVPVTHADRAGLRAVISPDQVTGIFEILSAPSRVTHTTWNRRFREFNDKMQGGVLREVAEVARDLAALRGDKDLSYGEAKMLDKAVSMLAHEIGAVLDKPAEEIEACIAAAIYQ